MFLGNMMGRGGGWGGGGFGGSAAAAVAAEDSAASAAAIPAAAELRAIGNDLHMDELKELVTKLERAYTTGWCR